LEKIKYFCQIRVIIPKDHILKLFNKHNYSLFLLGLISIIFLPACSVNKNKLTNRIYHNVSAHYNGFWNGRESYREGLKQLKISTVDNYAEVLPIFNYGTDQDLASLKPNMERAIQKASVVIQRHSMRFQNKEYNRWIDDSYLLMGKSYFYMGEFVSARRTFEFIVDEYKSQPAAYEAMLWLIRTYNRTGQFEKSEPLLNQFRDLIDYEDVPLGLQRSYPLIYADFYLQQNKYSESVDFLITATEINNSKQLVTRLKFILAQVYLKQGELESAADLFTEVIHRNPEYEMAFSAKINKAKSHLAGSGDAQEIINSLLTLLNDQKNEEYHDQIYYVLAEIELKEGNVSRAIEYLKSSVAKNINNDFQKVAASLKLADLYFEDQKYQNAKLYYDTAMQVIPLGYPNYQSLLDRTEVLVSLVGYLETVQLQDSLKVLAQMPENERLEVIDAIIAEIKEIEIKVQVEERQRMQDLSLARQQTSFTQTNQRDGAWYFYNPSTLSFGFTEFITKWGRRPLEDNWRLSQKNVRNISYSENLETEDISGANSETGTPASTDSRKDRSFYLKDIPLTGEQMQRSDEEIKDALYYSAMLFKEGLHDNMRAIEQFERLINDYPENAYLLQSYYYLYGLYSGIDESKSMHFKQKLLSQFPNSDYAKVVINPNYFKELSDQKSEIESLYFDTYQAYNNSQFFVSINLSERAISNYTDSILIPKFEYLRALSIGRIDEVDSLLVNMQRIVDRYPESDVVPLAQSMIRHYSTASIESVIGDEANVFSAEEYSVGGFKLNSDTTHLYVLIINSERINLDAVKLRLSDFNAKLKYAKPLTIANFAIDEQSNWIAVMGFDNMLESVSYFTAMQKDEYVLSMMDDSEYQNFVISVDNYTILLRDKNLEDYLKFYYKQYQTTN
jgi:tetratricopeptide (TPR) repeat protein